MKRNLRWAGIATAVVTINNDGEVPTRYAVEVFPYTLQPFGAFNAEVLLPR